MESSCARRRALITLRGTAVDCVNCRIKYGGGRGRLCETNRPSPAVYERTLRAGDMGVNVIVCLIVHRVKRSILYTLKSVIP